MHAPPRDGAPPAPEGPPTMPDFRRPRRGAHHTLDTALRVLHRLGVDDARIVVESAGPGWSDCAVVRQDPPAGTPLDPRTRVVLSIAGLGALEALPYALRDVDDSAFGVDPLLGLLDTPVHKLRHHLRTGGGFFALDAGDPATARRWLEYVFQLDPSPWPSVRWHAIARLLPVLHRVAGSADALTLALGLVFDLPVAHVRLTRAVVPVAAGGRLAVGVANARLGVDTLLGAGLAEAARLAVTIGPVPLARYLEASSDAARAERDALYALVLPAHLARTVEERWQVGDPGAPTRLGARGDVTGDAAGAAALGLTTRLGAMAPEAAGRVPDDAPAGRDA